ncbi:glycosyl hydrolase family 8 [Bernardetia sp. MNP-M8]|uniref:glycosyl hydrolase family 8 n=1 Tax=Bernardetia sp. MNP-M8 TaxID=3127470 RepID=UPI0030D0AE95
MNTRQTLICVCILSLFFIQNLVAQNYPFPQQKNWANSIKPNHISQNQLDTDVANYYKDWRDNFLKPTTMTGGYYVKGGCTNCSEPAKGTSEGHGWGMLITVLMAGHDSNAKTYYDGLYNYFDQHRSTINNELMSWMVENSENGGENSATDGDFDIAYSLILAHYQWGSDGQINYRQEAIDMINKGLKLGSMNTQSKRVMLGDWDTNAYTTRSSDWMTAQMRAYGQITGDSFWTESIDVAYNIMSQIRQNYSPNTGLMPDFVIGSTPQPATPNFLEADTDDDYSWNACRFPWRVAMDYGHYGNIDSKTTVNKIVNWAKSTTNNNPSQYKAGYTLSGTPLFSYTSKAFTAPLIVASTVDISHQAFLNDGWDHLKTGYYDYYDATINLLCMLYISGNWWKPEINPDTTTNLYPTISFTSPTNNTTFQEGQSITLTATANDSDGQIVKVEFYSNNQKIGETQTSPYTFSFDNASIGSYQFTAKATDNEGASTTSDIVTIVVEGDIDIPNVAPTISFTSPTNNTVFQEGQSINLTATANDSDGQIVKVEFYSNNQKIGETQTSPYAFSFDNASVGNYQFTAKATDNEGASTTSEIITVVVEDNTGGGNTNCSFGTPTSTSLPNLNKSYTNLHVIGNGPDLSNIINFSINWQNESSHFGLYQLSMSTNNGQPNWWVNLLQGTTHSLNLSQPTLTLSNTGISGFDGTYYAAIDGNNFVLVSTSSNFTIYFSNSSVAPSCNEESTLIKKSAFILYPNPTTDEIRIAGKEESVEVKIYDVSGALHISQTLNLAAGKNLINLRQLNNGIYYIKIVGKDATEHLQIFKE